jgi:hypothetical protein
MTKNTQTILQISCVLGMSYCILHLWKPISFPINIPFLPGYVPPGETGIVTLKGEI